MSEILLTPLEMLLIKKNLIAGEVNYKLAYAVGVNRKYEVFPIPDDGDATNTNIRNLMLKWFYKYGWSAECFKTEEAPRELGDLEGLEDCNTEFVIVVNVEKSIKEEVVVSIDTLAEGLCNGD